MTIHTLVYNLKPDRIIVNRKKSSIAEKPQIVCLFKIQKSRKKENRMIKKMLPSKNMVYLTNNLYIIRCYCWFNVRFIISVFVQVFTHLLGRILLAIFPEYIAMPGEDLFLP